VFGQSMWVQRRKKDDPFDRLRNKTRVRIIACMNQQLFMLWANPIACLIVALAEIVVGFKWMHKCESLHRLGMLLCGFAIAVCAVWQFVIAIVVMAGMQTNFFGLDIVQSVAKNISILGLVQNVVIAAVIYDHFRKL